MLVFEVNRRDKKVFNIIAVIMIRNAAQPISVYYVQSLIDKTSTTGVSSMANDGKELSSVMVYENAASSQL